MEKAPPTIFSRQRGKAKWDRAARRFASDRDTPFLLSSLIDDIIERLQFMRFSGGKALIIGDWSGRLQEYLARQDSTVSHAKLGYFEEEKPGSSSQFDLIVHLLGLGHVNDLPGALIHAREALAEGGLFIAAFPGAGSLHALRQVALAADGEQPSPRCHPLIDNQAAAGLLQRANFRRQVVDCHTLSVRYSTFERLISDLRDHGLTNSLRQLAPPFNKARMARAHSRFAELAEEDGKVSETFEMLTLTGWK